jgi:hypothetical protein
MSICQIVAFRVCCEMCDTCCSNYCTSFRTVSQGFLQPTHPVTKVNMQKPSGLASSSRQCFWSDEIGTDLNNQHNETICLRALRLACWSCGLDYRHGNYRDVILCLIPVDWMWGLKDCLGKGRLDLAMAQVVSRRPLIAEARVRVRFNPCGICSGQSGTRTGFSPSSSVFPCLYYSTVALQTHIIWGMRNMLT